MTPAEIAQAVARLEAMRTEFAAWARHPQIAVPNAEKAKAITIALACLRDYTTREEREQGRAATVQAEALRRAAYLHNCEHIACAYCMNLKMEARDKDTLALSLLKLDGGPDGT